MINVGLLGFGMAGQVFHAPLIASTSGLRLTAIATSTSAARAAQEYRGVRICSVQAAIEATDLDLLVIATPNDSHAELTLRAFDAGKSVVVDKPMATCLHDAERMAERAAQRNLKLSVFHNRRWDDDFLTLREIFTSGRLGDWTGFESRFDRYRPAVPDRWRDRPGPGSGIWWDLGPHLIDQALTLFGRPDAIRADLLAQRTGAQVHDYAHVALHYGRRRAILHASCLEPDPGFRLRLQGTRGAFASRGLDPQEAFLKSDRSRPPDARYAEVTVVGEGSTHAARELLLQGDYGTYYRAIQQCLASGRPVPVTAEDGIATVKILEAAERSAESGVEIAL